MTDPKTKVSTVLGYLIFDCCRDNPCEGEDVDAKMPSVSKPVVANIKADQEFEEEEKNSKHDYLKREKIVVTKPTP